MEKFLSISPVCPNDSIGHAGGKTFNFYLKELNKKEVFDVRSLFFCDKASLNQCDLQDYGIRFDSILTRGNLWTDVKHGILDIVGRLFFRNELFSLYKLNEILRYLKRLKEKNETPDIIELEWTNFAYYAKYIKRRYPEIKLVASEHDIAYQAFQRKKVSSRKLSRVKKQELDALKQCDLILVQSEKDRQILVDDGINNRILVIAPYYHNMSSIERKSVNHDILFWGAMYRPENYEAAIWFIKHVMPLLSDLPVRFVVAGNRPPRELTALQSSTIKVTGFLEDETSLFSQSMCFVSPLLTGAGIKVKIIEALSSGIPILTNRIGIEGIPAINGCHYFHCEKAAEYASVIRNIYLNHFDIDIVGSKQRSLVEECYNLDKSMDEYSDALISKEVLA